MYIYTYTHTSTNLLKVNVSSRNVADLGSARKASGAQAESDTAATQIVYPSIWKKFPKTNITARTHEQSVDRVRGPAAGFFLYFLMPLAATDRAHEVIATPNK